MKGLTRIRSGARFMRAKDVEEHYGPAVEGGQGRDAAELVDVGMHVLCFGSGAALGALVVIALLVLGAI